MKDSEIYKNEGFRSASNGQESHDAVRHGRSFWLLFPIFPREVLRPFPALCEHGRELPEFSYVPLEMG